MTRPVLITGADGSVGSALWPRLQSSVPVRLLDMAAVPDLPPEVEAVRADITDREALRSAMQGVGAVVHLAGNRYATSSFGDLVQPNLVGVHTVLDVAAEVGVSRVVLASSCHASGMYDVERTAGVDPAWLPRPCCPYGVSKVYAEAAGRWFAERTDLSVICLRFGAVTETPYGPIGAPFWLSHDDLGRLVSGALATPVKYGIYYGGSANARERWNLEPGMRDLGYLPQDDSAGHEIDMSLPVPVCYAGSV